MLSQIADDNLAKQVSSSWSGGSLDPDPSSDQALVQMAMQGQSFFNAVGDSDAFLSGERLGFRATAPTPSSAAEQPCTQPALVAAMSGRRSGDWGVEFGEDGEGGSGGVSTSYSIPPWQQGVAMAANQGSSAMRNVPDVALTADHVFVTYNNGATTGLAAPVAPRRSGRRSRRWSISRRPRTAWRRSVSSTLPSMRSAKAPTTPTVFTTSPPATMNGAGARANIAPCRVTTSAQVGARPNGANLINALVWMATNKPYMICAGPVVSGGNGVIDYDDCVLLSLPDCEPWRGTATVVTATLTTSTPGVTVTQPGSTYSNLAFGAIATNNTPFQISTSPSFVCGTPILLSLVLSYTGGSVTNTLTMSTCQCPTIQTNGGLSGASPTQTNWLWPSGTNSTCSLPKACSGEAAAVGTVAYNAYSFTNTSSSAVCVSVTVSSTCGTNVYHLHFLGGISRQLQSQQSLRKLPR